MVKHDSPFLFLLILLILCGCSSANPQEETIVQTQTVETEYITETVPETSRHTEPVTEPSTEPETEPFTEPATEPVTEPEVIASQIVEGFRVFVNSSNQTFRFCDDSHYTKNYIYPTSTLSVESVQPFSALYIEWDIHPGAYRIVWEGGSVDCGENGFLHEYVRLPQSVTRVEFAFLSEDPVLLCDIEGYTEGTAPFGVQDWQAPCEEADILVFPTHSDDDALFFGPLISYYAIEQGLTVQTAFMVEHDGYEERNHERLNGLWELGVRNYPVLGTAPDTATTSFYYAMLTYEDSNIAAWQVEQIRRFKPLVVVGHDLDGEYGNGGHKVNAHFLTQSITAASDPQLYPESSALYGTWETPKMYLHLYEENRIMLDVNIPLQNDPLGRTTFEIAEDAYDHHTSQHQYNFRVIQDDRLPQYDCRYFGLYHTLVGYDTGVDIMENIDSAQWREK